MNTTTNQSQSTSISTARIVCVESLRHALRAQNTAWLAADKLLAKVRLDARTWLPAFVTRILTPGLDLTPAARALLKEKLHDEYAENWDEYVSLSYAQIDALCDVMLGKQEKMEAATDDMMRQSERLTRIIIEVQNCKGLRVV